MSGRPVAPRLGLAEIVLRLETTPRISCGVMAGDAARHYGEWLREILGDPDVTVALGEAYRLLDAEALAGTVLRWFAGRDNSIAGTWDCPNFEAVLPELRTLAWHEALANRLRVTGLSGPLRKRRQTYAPEQLAALQPDFGCDQLRFEGRVAIVAVQIEPASPAETAAMPVPAQPPQTTSAPKPVSAAALTACVEAIAKEWTRSQPPALEGELLPLVRARLGAGVSVTRKRVRDAVKDHVPQWIRKRGHPVGT
jgi:hypothetical protein